jgi:hypothetical protein
MTKRIYRRLTGRQPAAPRTAALDPISDSTGLQWCSESTARSDSNSHYFSLFSSLFFSAPPEKFFSDSAGPFTELRSG